MGKKSRRNKTKPAKQGNPYDRLAKLYEEEKHKKIVEEESEWLLMATELEDTSRAAGHIGKEESLCTALNIYNVLAAIYCEVDIDSTLKYHEKSWSLVEELLSLGVNLDRLSPNNTYGSPTSGINFVGALFAAKKMNWLGQSVAVLKCIIKETPSHHEMTPRDEFLESSLCELVRDASLSLIWEGEYTDVYDILTAMLDTIDNVWDDRSKAEAYTALSIVCSDSSNTDDLQKREQADLFYKKAAVYTHPLEKDDRRWEFFRAAGRFYMLDFQNEKAISMLEKAMCFHNNEDPGHAEMRLDMQILIGKVLLNKDACVEAMERFNLALGIAKDRGEDFCMNLEKDLGIGPSYTRMGISSFGSNFGIGRSYTKMGMWSQAQHYLETAFEIAKGFDFMIVELNMVVDKLLTSFWIERLLVDQYCTDEQLIHVSEEKRKELLHKALDYAGNTLSTSMSGEDSDYHLKDELVNASFYGTSASHIYLCHAELYFLLGKLHGAKQFLKAYFEEMLKDTKQRCQGCLQQKNEAVCKPANLHQICQECQVAHYCSKDHFKLDWNRGRLGHKKLCGFLKRWRLVTKMEMKRKAKYAVDDSYEEIFSEFFDTIFGIHETSE